MAYLHQFDDGYDSSQDSDYVPSEPSDGDDSYVSDTDSEKTESMCSETDEEPEQPVKIPTRTSTREKRPPVRYTAS